MGKGWQSARCPGSRALGYQQVTRLEGGLDGWRRADGELFRDVNVPSKAFGELVEARRHTPSISAEDLKARSMPATTSSCSTRAASTNTGR